MQPVQTTVTPAVDALTDNSGDSGSSSVAAAVSMGTNAIQSEEENSQQQEEKQSIESTNRKKLDHAVIGLQSFLTDAKQYFQGLISRCNDYITSVEEHAVEQTIQMMKQHVLHRINIILGDLERYSWLYTERKSETHWESAREYYIKSLELYPFNGNAHNQLAVLATYNSSTKDDPLLVPYALNEMEAIYRYFRSLAVPEKPFSSARENLINLFEKNRLRFLQLQQTRQQQRLEMAKEKKRRKGRKRGEQMRDQKEKLHVDLGTLLTQFVRMHGILFTRTSLETMDDIKRQVLRELKILREQHNTDNRLSEELALRLVAMNIFCIECSMDNDCFLEMAVDLGCRFMRHLAESCANPRTGEFLYLSSIHAMLKYMRLKLVELKSQQDHENSQLKFQNRAMWRSIASLLNRIKNFAIVEPDMQDKAVALPEDVELMGFKPLMELADLEQHKELLNPDDRLSTNLRMMRIKKEADILLELDDRVLTIDESDKYRAGKDIEMSTDEINGEKPHPTKDRQTEKKKKRNRKKKPSAGIIPIPPIHVLSDDDLFEDIRSDASDDIVLESGGFSVEQWTSSSSSSNVQEFISASPRSMSTSGSSGPMQEDEINDTRAIGDEEERSMRFFKTNEMHDLAPQMQQQQQIVEQEILSPVPILNDAPRQYQPPLYPPSERSTRSSSKLMQQLLDPTFSAANNNQDSHQQRQQPSSSYSLFSSGPGMSMETSRPSPLSSGGARQSSFFSSTQTLQNNTWSTAPTTIPSDSPANANQQWLQQHAIRSPFTPIESPSPSQHINTLWGTSTVSENPWRPFMNGSTSSGVADRWNSGLAVGSGMQHSSTTPPPPQPTSTPFGGLFPQPFHGQHPSVAPSFQAQVQQQQQQQQQERKNVTSKMDTRFLGHQFRFGDGAT